jgi:UDP-glucuronate decarboxylase
VSKQIIVTGGAGFLGSNLCKKLVAMGHGVLAIDNLCTGSQENLKELMENEMFEFVNYDITEPFEVDNVDQIYNLACPASPVHYQRMPIETMKSSVFGVFNLLDLAKSCGAKILQASTSEVYGDAQSHPQKENYWGNVNPMGVRSCYDEGKRAAESIFFDYHRQYGVNIKISRIFNTYGPNMAADDGRVVSNFIIQALKGEPITIFGNGEQTRSFCYVDDLINGLVGLMESPDSFTGPVNIGNPGEITMLELATAIIKLTESKSEILFKPLPEDDPVRRCPDIDLARRNLLWEPEIKLKDGLCRTICYFAKLLNVRVPSLSQNLL